MQLKFEVTSDKSVSEGIKLQDNYKTMQTIYEKKDNILDSFYQEFPSPPKQNFF